MSRVISSGPSLVSRATTVSSSMWIEVKAVFGDDTLVDQDRVLEVVAIPRHERDQHVLAKRKLAHVGRCTIGDHVTLGDDVAHFTSGRWLMLVFWLERVYLIRSRYQRRLHPAQFRH
jgi:hypothetical protein